MAGSSNDTVFINPSPENSGFPPYLDFTTLRSNAINYLGPITGKYWTDYNVHDPGITTLEVLTYAIIDLGYRANLPIGSLLAPGSAGTAATSATSAAGAGTASGTGPFRSGIMTRGDTGRLWRRVRSRVRPGHLWQHPILIFSRRRRYSAAIRHRSPTIANC